MSGLKRCPFCGEKMILSHRFAEHPNGYLKWMRFHPDNKCILSAFSIDLRETERVKEWNTRKPMENIMERLEEFGDEAKQFGVSGMLSDMLEIVKEEGE